MQMTRLKPIAIFCQLLLLPTTLMAQSSTPPIIIDGEFADWNNRSTAYQDPAGDQFAGSLDFQKLWISDTDDFLILNIEIGEELLMQQFNTIILHIDVDNDAATGTLINGIGADLEWQFGNRSGTFRWNGQSVAIGQSSIGIVTAPTVSGNQFEIALERQAVPISGTTLLPETTIRLLFEDSGSGEDMLPDIGATLTYSFTDTGNAASPPYQIPKAAAAIFELSVIMY